MFAHSLLRFLVTLTVSGSSFLCHGALKVGGFVADLESANECDETIRVSVKSRQISGFEKNESDLNVLIYSLMLQLRSDCPELEEVVFDGYSRNAKVYESRIAVDTGWINEVITGRDILAAEFIAAEVKAYSEKSFPDIESILDSDAEYSEHFTKLRKMGMASSIKDLRTALDEEGNRRLEDGPYFERFVLGIDAFGAEQDSVMELSKIGLALSQYEERFPGIARYVGAVRLKMRAILDRQFDMSLDELTNNFDEVDELLMALEEVEELSRWFELWEASDLAVLAKVEIDHHLDLVATSQYTAYMTDLSELPVKADNWRLIMEKLHYFENGEERIPAFARYRERLWTMIGEIENKSRNQLFQRFDIADDASTLFVDAAGRRVPIGFFAEQLESSGQTIHSISTVRDGEELGNVYVDSLIIEAEERRITLSMMEPGSRGDTFLPDLISAGTESEDLYPDEWVQLVVNLGAIVPTGWKDERGVTDCDRFASDPYDDSKVVDHGIFEEDIDIEFAMDACLAAVELYPNEPRYHFNLGRVLYIAEQSEEAKLHLAVAAQAGYGAANYYLGLQLSEPVFRSDSSDEIDLQSLRLAIEEFQAAASRGYPQAKGQIKSIEDMVTSYRPPFDRETFSMPEVLESIYDRNFSYFEHLTETRRQRADFYLFGLFAICKRKDESFANSKARHMLEPIVPTSWKEVAEYNASRSSSTRDSAYATLALMGAAGEGNYDADILVMYLEPLKGEMERFFTNVYDYLML